jgi:hypothetical protein
LRIDARQVRSFMQVAINTGKGKVTGIVRPSTGWLSRYVKLAV